MREIRFADVDSIEPGTVLTFERGVTGQPGYHKFVRVYDTKGNPNYPRFAIYEDTVKDRIRDLYVVTADK